MNSLRRRAFVGGLAARRLVVEKSVGDNEGSDQLNTGASR
jgi:hypothetical protein